jgi:hypothetical protein
VGRISSRATRHSLNGVHSCHELQLCAGLAERRETLLLAPFPRSRLPCKLVSCKPRCFRPMRGFVSARRHFCPHNPRELARSGSLPTSVASFGAVPSSAIGSSPSSVCVSVAVSRGQRQPSRKDVQTDEIVSVKAWGKGGGCPILL